MGASYRRKNKHPGKSPKVESWDHVIHANERGVVNVRRQINDSSLPLVEQIGSALDRELTGCGRVFPLQDMGVTLVGFSRFDKRTRNEGPSTRSVSERIASSYRSIEVGLGSLAFYGERYTKDGAKKLISADLVIELMGGELHEEEAAYRKEYANLGLPLRDHPFGTGYCPHLSVAVVYNQLRELADPRSIRRLNAVTGLGHSSMKSIILEPTLRPIQSPYETAPTNESLLSLDKVWDNGLKASV